MQCAADKRGGVIRWRLAALIAQLSKDQSIQIKGVQRALGNPRSEPSKPHFLKVNFRKILFLVGKPSVQGIKFSLLI